MSARDDAEKILRDLQVLISGADVYEHDDEKIILDHDHLVSLLRDLNKCFYAMLEEYELTKEGRDAAEREFQKQADAIIADANKKAQDIYAASVMYTNEVLGGVQQIIDQTTDSMQQACAQTTELLSQERLTVRQNQTALRGELQDLADTDKYMQLISERNQQIEKEKEEKEKRRRDAEERRARSSSAAGGEKELKGEEEELTSNGFLEYADDFDEQALAREVMSMYADRRTPVRVDAQALRRLGLSSAEEEGPDEAEKSAESDILDAASAAPKTSPKKVRPASSGADPLTVFNLDNAPEPQEEPYDFEEEELIPLNLHTDDYFATKPQHRRQKKHRTE